MVNLEVLMKTELDRLRKEFQTATDRIDGAIQSIYGQFDKMNKKIESTEERLDSLGREIALLANNDQETRFESLEQKMQRMSHNEKTKKRMIIVGIILVLLFGYFVWPTPYNYSQLQGIPIRVNKITGTTEIAGQKGWQPLSIGGK